MHILVIERPLEGEGKKPISTDDNYQMFCIPMERNHETDLKFLRSILDNENPINDLKNMVEEFNETYVYVKGYSGFAVDRIAQILQRAVQVYIHMYINACIEFFVFKGKRANISNKIRRIKEKRKRKK